MWQGCGGGRVARPMVVGVVAGLLLMALVGSNVPALAKTTIIFWYGWAGDEARALEQVIADFNKSQSAIEVRGESLGGWENEQQKLLTAIAGGTPPDAAALLSASVLGTWAENGTIQALDPFIEKSKYDLSDFLPVALEYGRYKETTYALPFLGDVYGLVWNKDLFLKAGFAPDRPPATIEELTSMARKLTRTTSGRMDQMGFLPNWPWSHFPLYAWAFGGGFFDPNTKAITADDPANVRALLWEKAFYTEYGINVVNSFKSGFGQYATGSNPFYTGKLAMAVEGEWQPAFIARYAPKLNWNAAPFPHPKDRPDLAGTTETTGNLLVIPTGSRHPQEAWTFISWLAGQKPSLKFAVAIKNIPHLKSLLAAPELARDPHFAVFLKLAGSRNARTWPSLPVSSFYQTELQSTEEAVLLGQVDARTALQQLRTKVEEQMKAYR